MILTTLGLLIVGSSFSSVAALVSNRRAKRIAFGEPVPSLATYKTYYFVQLRRSWACVTDQTDHEDSLTRCQEDHHICGGTLIHPEFVLTAAHCVMYFEVVVYEKFKGNGTDDWIKDTADLIRYSLVEAWEKLQHTVIGFFVVPKPRHTVYSDWALLVGSHDWYKMTQKRHVVKVFPHEAFPKGNIRVGEAEKLFGLTLNEWHDVALLQACLPFKIKSREVELAPMLKTAEQLREQYERIVESGMVCLYIGFGYQDNEGKEAQNAGHPRFEKNLMLHTWRSSACNTACNYDLIRDSSLQHSCVLCSWHHGAKFGVPQGGDSGSPVTCEGKFVSTLTKAVFSKRINYTRTDSYPVHCIIKSINDERLKYYKTVPHDQYHPLSSSRLRRFQIPFQ